MQAKDGFIAVMERNLNQQYANEIHSSYYTS